MTSISKIHGLFENVFSYPQLDTILMVEKSIEEHSATYKKKALWESLPKKMKYQTFKVILNYLEYSHKIAFDRAIDAQLTLALETTGKFNLLGYIKNHIFLSILVFTIMLIILEWFDHKNYEKRFKY